MHNTRQIGNEGGYGACFAGDCGDYEIPLSIEGGESGGSAGHRRCVAKGFGSRAPTSSRSGEKFMCVGRVLKCPLSSEDRPPGRSPACAIRWEWYFGRLTSTGWLALWLARLWLCTGCAGDGGPQKGRLWRAAVCWRDRRAETKSAVARRAFRGRLTVRTESLYTSVLFERSVGRTPVGASGRIEVL